MQKFTHLSAPACPLDVVNLNTDQLLPARYLKWPRSAGLGKVLLHDLRFDAQENEQPDFPLNRPVWRNAQIMVGRANFGCGSSREAAVYALLDYGIRCVIAPSFGDIFSGNAVQNGLLPAIVSDTDAATLIATLYATLDEIVSIDLEGQAITCAGTTYPFSIDPVRRTRLLTGWDDIALTMSFEDQIASFKTADRTRRPWATPSN
jgi:3-isopropylmalate/(R)-2-methylmalate dehydratase small subunit